MNYREACDTIGVPYGVDADALKARYRKLAMANHPDRHPDDPSAVDRFQRITEAHDVIQESLGRRMQGKRPSLRRPTRAPRPAARDAAFPGDRVPRSVPRIGPDLPGKLEVTLREVFHGTQTDITFEDLVGCERCATTGGEPGTPMVVCPACRGDLRDCEWCAGKGQVPDQRCDRCLGAGVLRTERTVRVPVARSARDGEEIVLLEQGPWGLDRRGALRLRLAVQCPPGVRRDGDDVRTEVVIGVIEAVLGGTANLDEIDGGKVRVKIPAGTSSGKTVRLVGKGLYRPGRDDRGDLLATVAIRVPADLTDRERDLWGLLLTEQLQRARARPAA